jgi:hypothetical protein
MDGEIDWNDPAETIERLTRAAGSPYPGAYTYFADTRDQGRIKKMVICHAHVQEHPDQMLAVPGHLIRLEGQQIYAVACGDGNLLVLDQILIDGNSVLPVEFFRTVSQRLGLDNEAMIRAIQNPELVGADPYQKMIVDLEAYMALVNQTIESVVDILVEKGTRVVANPIRNYSFQTRHYDWENQDRFFGVQIYRSFRLQEIKEETVAIGYWLLSERDKGVRKMVYVTIMPDDRQELGASLDQESRKLRLAIGVLM